MTDSQRLLAEYVRNGSEPAFRELVARYLNLVYSTALRIVGGDAHLAEDVAQTVFVDLARLARRFSNDVMLGGWLHRHTCFVAAKAVRSDRRRQLREREAVEMNAPLDHSQANLAQVAPILDEAINQLGAEDRAAVLLRFFEQCDFRSVGEALGTNEDAARMRVNRALEKLHGLLTRRGVTLSAAALGTALATDAVTAAPAGLGTTISGSALAAATAGSGTILAALKALVAAKPATVGAIAIAAVAAPLVVQQNASARFRAEDRSLLTQIDRLRAEQQHLAAAGEQAPGSRSLSDLEQSELETLRGEVDRLRADSNQLAQLKAAALKDDPNYRAGLIKQRLDANPDKKIPELQLLHDGNWLSVARMPIKLETEEDFRKAFAHLRRFARQDFGTAVVKALHAYARTNYGQLPSDLSQLLPYLPAPVNDTMLQRYELKRTGKLSEVPQLGPYGSPGRETAGSIRTEPVAVEKGPVDDKFDSLLSIEAYGISTRQVSNGRDDGSVSWKLKPGADGTLELVVTPPLTRTNEVPIESPAGDTLVEKVDPIGAWTWYEVRGGGGSFGPGGGFGGGGTSVRVVLKLKSDAGKVIGTLAEPASGTTQPIETTISNAELIGKRISFTVTQGGRYGSPSTVRFHGIIAGDKIIGSEGDYLDWDATRVK